MNVAMRVDATQNHKLAAEIRSLAARTAGRIAVEADGDYEALRAVPHINWDYRPLFVARVASADDVAQVVGFARDHNLELAIRSGGHSVCGHSSSNGGVAIDLRDLNGIDIDLEAMTVWAGCGLTAGEVSRALDEKQMVVGFGDTAGVGIGGLTLGGGVGYMARKHGLTIDSLLAAEIVTANGEILIASETDHPELFWALRGGGGNFGVVTRFQYRLNPLPEFVGGPLVLPATPEVVAGFVAASKAAPEELTTILLAMPAPPMPFLPPELFGKTVVIGMMAYAGPVDDAQAALAPFRALATPIADLVRPGPYSIMYLPEDPNMRPTVSCRSLFTDDIDLAMAAEILKRVQDCEAPMHIAQIRTLGGAVARVPTDATAYAHRTAPLLVAFLAMDGSPAAAVRHDQWARDSVAAVGGSDTYTYVNFLAEEGMGAREAAYPGSTWARLRDVKKKYDPRNLFRLNQNIPPA